MFILEEPYISNLMLNTLEKNQFEVLESQISLKYSKDFKLNIINEQNALSVDRVKIYSNSENSLNWVFNHFDGSDFVKLLNICKNKYVFRKKLASIFPNFFFSEISFDDLDLVKIDEFPQEFIIKPTVGFLSMGVHKVASKQQWEQTLQTIKKEVVSFKKYFPEEVLKSSSFIVEEIIKGDEFAIDMFYDKNGEPVVLNIFQHPFVSADDVSDRIYISSKKIIDENLGEMTNLLKKIGEILELKDFPMHIEVIKKQNGEIIPVEINPMRFAGWCTTDLAYYAYGINIYEYFEAEKKPNWTEILKGKENKIYYFAMAETPSDIDKERITFDYKGLKSNFSNILEFREINYKEKPLFAILFGETETQEEITRILQLNMKDFIK